MGYYDAVQAPVYDVLAREFLICQRWFAAHPDKSAILLRPHRA